MKEQILELLRQHSDKYMSGEELCKRFAVSRTAIWKHIKDLQEDGYQIEGVRNRGYRLLAVPDLVTGSEIRNGLQTRRFGQYVVDLKNTGSTNVIAAKLADEGEPEGTLVIADQQTGGKGRRGRAWYSPGGTGIWMSLILRPELPMAQAPQLTLVAAVAVSLALTEIVGQKAGIKWPNDILFEDRKVCGILTEMNMESEEINSVIVGIGVNVNQELHDFPLELQDRATSLRMVTGQRLQRAAAAQRILEQFEVLYDLFLREGGFAPIRELWKRQSVTIGKQVVAQTPRGVIKGIAVDIDEMGALVLRDEQGQVQKIYSADILLAPPV
jgi:BirA family biotin operon repressor/biotin-[acetyl-CoA-carboxylase] ligase